MKKIFIASDHGGFKLKSFLVQQLGVHHELIDLGPKDDKSVDYPDYAKILSENVLKNSGSQGILLCGSGQGMAITANKFKGIRAALCWDEVSAKLSREHNNTNVLCLGGRLIPDGLALLICEKWLTTEFAGGRHQNRVSKMDELGC